MMPSEPDDARVLFDVAPDQYVAERTRLVKQAKAARDKDAAAFYQGLKRPSLSLWAVLVAAGDADAVRSVVAATTELGAVQAAGGAPAALSKATKQRRAQLEAMTDRAVAALTAAGEAGQPRRAEIRGLIDQLSRQPDTMESWIDGTLREVGDASLGFAAFTGIDVAVPARERPAPDKAARARTGAKAEPAKAEAGRPEPAKPDPAKLRAAQRGVDVATRSVTNAERRVDAARRAVREAEASLRLAEKDLATAVAQHEQAIARLEAAM